MTEPLNPGDEVAPGTPGSGEDVCPVCHGSGKQAAGAGEDGNDGAACTNCGGTGVIQEAIGGG